MHRFRYLGIALCLFSAAVFVTSCEKEDQPKATVRLGATADTRATDEAAIRAVDTEWLKAGQAKNVDGWVSFYADNATLMIAGAPVATGKDAIRKTLASLMANPGFAVTFGPTKVEVSKSGDLAYDLGNYSLTLNDAKGKPQTTNAMYVVVWGKQADGSWKVLIDSPGTTTP
jgi:uncharacterized protein (TIGR02246 family)